MVKQNIFCGNRSDKILAFSPFPHNPHGTMFRVSLSTTSSLLLTASRWAFFAGIARGKNIFWLSQVSICCGGDVGVLLAKQQPQHCNYLTKNKKDTPYNEITPACLTCLSKIEKRRFSHKHYRKNNWLLNGISTEVDGHNNASRAPEKQ